MGVIFDDVERNDLAPKRHGETEFAFSNRSARPEFGLVRNLVEELLAEYPEGERAELIARIRSGVDDAFRSATFELILHGEMVRLGATLECHPEVPGSSGRPDFKVTLPNGSFFYLEASAITTRDGTDRKADARKGVVYDAVNRIKNPNFYLDVSSRGNPDTPPKSKPLRATLEKWLEGLDPDEVAKGIEENGYGSAPTLEWEHEEWRLTIRAVPKSPARRQQGERSIGTHTDGLKQVDGWTPIRDRVMEKGRRYGADLDAPLVVAINTGAFNLEKIDVMQALFGQESFELSGGEIEMRRLPNGVWQNADGPQYRRISGVLVYNDLKPSNIATRKQDLYLNPWATHPVPPFLGDLPHHKLEGEKMIEQQGLCLRCIFVLSPEWPEEAGGTDI